MKRFQLRRGLVALLLPGVLLFTAPSVANNVDDSKAAAVSVPRVVASIKPIHSLVAAVMEGVGEPSLLVEGNASPHTFSLKPSSAGLLQDADLVFWVGPDLEQFLARPLASLAANADRIALGNSTQSNLPEQEDEHHDEAHQHATDAHVWLNPDRAVGMLMVIADRLSAHDPLHAPQYRLNAEVASDEIAQLTLTIEQRLMPWLDVPYIVFHDAYGAFEDRFSINRAIPFLLNPESGSGADRIQRMQTMIQDEGVVCLFTEPQFPSAIVDVIGEGSDIRRGVLDPLGGELEPGPALYSRMMSDLADELLRCLADP